MTIDKEDHLGVQHDRRNCVLLKYTCIIDDIDLYLHQI